MSVEFPDNPPKKVNHEHLGISVFVKTHPFGHMGHIRKGVRSHELRNWSLILEVIILGAPRDSRGQALLIMNIL